MPRFLTDRGRSADGGWPLDEVPDDALANMLSIPLDQVPARRAALARQLGEPSWVANALEALPATTLAILQVLAELGGIALDTDLATAAKQRYQLDEDRLRRAVLVALRAALVVPLATNQTRSALALLQPAAALVSALVADLDLLPRRPEDFAVRDEALGDSRVFLALCAAAGHMDLKLTMDGQLHRGAVKRLAKQAGADERRADHMLSFALHTRYLVRDGDLARPDLDALVAAARGEYAAATGLPALQAVLADGPVDRDTLLRWSQRHRLGQVEQVLRSAGLGYLPGFAEGTVDGVAAIAYRAPGGSASGHVMPSFEVILPPESRLLDIVQVGACCDWVRLDRAIVARITKPSVMRALAAGASAAQILDGLTAVSRNPLPQNVEVAVRDWAGATATAAIATGHVVVIDPAAESRALVALGKLAARKIAPGVLVVDDKHPAREVERALLQAGVFVQTGAPTRSHKPAGGAEVAPSRGDTRLRAKVVAWRRGERVEDLDLPDDELDRTAPAGPPPGPARPASAEQTPQRVRAQLAEWAARHQAHRVSVDDTVADLLTQLPAGAFEAQLSRTRDPDTLLQELAQLLVRSGLGKPAPSRSREPRRSAPPARAQPQQGPSPAPLAWQRDDLRSRLEAAARREAYLALEVNGDVRYVAIERVTRRGKAWMVLGEDLRVEVPVALPLDTITAIAELSEDFDPVEDDDDDEVVRRPWLPAPGHAIPAGHVLCPCGSGIRYRNCCRSAAQA